MTEYHQYYYDPTDGSIAIRREPGDLWEIINGGSNSGAAKMAAEQNRV